MGSDTEIRQGSGIGPTVKTYYNPYDWYCSVQAQIGDALAIGKMDNVGDSQSRASFRKSRIPK